MTKPTFSLAQTGYGAHNPVVSFKPLVVGDTDVDGNVVGNTIGGQKRAMMTGEPIICQSPSGQLRAHKIDAERSDPSRGLLYLIPL